MKKHLWIVPLFLIGIHAQAQPTAEIRVVRKYLPANIVKAYIAAYCNGAPAYGLTQYNFTFIWAGDTIPQSTMARVGQPSLNSCCYSALVFDNSNAMIGASADAAVQAGKTFIDSMKTDCERATIISFSDSVKVVCTLTPDTAMLRAAVQNIGQAGGNRSFDIIDGINAAITQVKGEVTMFPAPIIALTSGKDNLSVGRLNGLIGQAQDLFRRIFPVSIGTNADSVSLTRLARETGGKYFRLQNLSQLTGVYREISSFTHRRYDEYVIDFVATSFRPWPVTFTAVLSICNDTVSTSFDLGILPPMGAENSDGAAPGSPLLSVYPHPVSIASGTAQISFSIPPGSRNSFATLTLIDMLGRETAVLQKGNVAPGAYTVPFSTARLNPGVYFCRLRMGETAVTKTMVVVW